MIYDRKEQQHLLIEEEPTDLLSLFISFHFKLLSNAQNIFIKFFFLSSPSTACFTLSNMFIHKFYKIMIM